MRGRHPLFIVAAGLGLLLCPVLAGLAVADKSGSSEKGAAAKSSSANGMTVVHIATAASSPADAKRIATGFMMAQDSAKAGRKTIVYLNGGAAKLATQGLSLASDISGPLQLSSHLSTMKQNGIQIFAATANVPGMELNSGNLRSGIKPLSAVELFKKITPESVVLSF